MKKMINMPKLSDKMDHGIIVSWNKQAGDSVKKGDIIFEVETDKVVSEVEAMNNGILKEVLFEEGDSVKTGEIVAILECEDE